jgi:uncharacterized membrane protein YkoI
MKRRLRVLLWLTVLILMIGLVGVYALIQVAKKEAPRVAATLKAMPTPTAEKLLTARQAYDLAVERARGQYGSVYLDELNAGGGTIGITTLNKKVDDDGRASSWDVYFMRFDPDAQSYILVFVVVENGEVARISDSKPLKMYSDLDHYLKYESVDMERVKISGADAVRIADENGGDKFTRIMLKLTQSSGQPIWIVAFGPGSREKGEHPGLTIWIDAETGEVVSKETEMYHIS